MSNLDLPTLMQKLESVLGAELGRFENGQLGICSTPPIPPTGTPTGLICFVNATPQTRKVRGSTGGQKTIEEYFVVSLVQYNRSKNTTVGMRLMQKNFSLFACDVVPGDDTKYEQAIIRVNNFGFI